MPTKMPRIGVTLSEDLYQLVWEVSDETGRSMSGLIVEILEDHREALQQIHDSFQDERETSRELCRRYEERVGMPLREIEELASASARPTGRRHSRAA